MRLIKAKDTTSMIRSTSLFTSFFMLLLGLMSPLRASAANAADQKIQLAASADFAGAKGTAKYRNRSGEREFQVEVEVAPRLVGTVYTVTANGIAVGKVTITTLGAGKLSLNSRLGQTVPMIVSGSPVVILTATGGVVVSGRF